MKLRIRALARILAGTLVMATVTSCGGSGYNAFVAPGKFTLYDCEQLAAQAKNYVAREKELKKAKRDAATAPGGFIISPLGYGFDDAIVQGTLKEIRNERATKSCSDQIPGLAVDAD